MVEAEKKTPTTTAERWPRKIRGTLSVAKDDTMEFRPQQPGQPQQEIVAETKAGKLYRTRSAKSPQMVAHVSVPSDCADPADEMALQLERLTAAVAAKPRPARLRGRVLLKDDVVDVRASRKEARLQIMIDVDLKSTPSVEKFVFNQMQRINQCLAINRTFLVRLK